MKHLVKFENAEQYEAAQSGLIKPNVSLIKGENIVKYEPIVKPTMEYVDLGLPSGTKWAIMNLGATAITDIGSKYAWGETEPKEYFSCSNYKYSKYKTDEDEDECKYVKYSLTGLSTLELSDDAAYVMLGEGWRIPSKAQFEELGQNVNTEWVFDEQMRPIALKCISTVEGYTDKYIMFPITEYYEENEYRIWMPTNQLQYSYSCYFMHAERSEWSDKWVEWSGTNDGIALWVGNPIRAVYNKGE